MNPFRWYAERKEAARKKAQEEAEEAARKKIAKAIDEKDYAFLGNLTPEEINQRYYYHPTFLGYAVGKGDLKTVDTLLSRGGDPNSPMIVNGISTRPCLIHMIALGNYDIATCLLEHGADVNVQDDWGRTALHWAAQSGSEDSSYRPGGYKLFEFVMSHNPDVTVKDKSGITPIRIALGEGLGANYFSERTPDVIEKLVEKGETIPAEVFTVPIMSYAAYKGSVPLLKYLVENGPGIDNCPEGPEHVLGAAIDRYFQKPETIRYILEHTTRTKSMDEKREELLVGLQKLIQNPIIHDPRDGDYPMDANSVDKLKETAQLLENPPAAHHHYVSQVSSGVSENLRKTRGIEASGSGNSIAQNIGEMLRNLRKPPTQQLTALQMAGR